VLQHDFFRSIDWRKLTAKEVRFTYLLTYLLTCARRNTYVSTTTPETATHSGPNAIRSYYTSSDRFAPVQALCATALATLAILTMPGARAVPATN